MIVAKSAEDRPVQARREWQPDRPLAPGAHRAIGSLSAILRTCRLRLLKAERGTLQPVSYRSVVRVPLTDPAVRAARGKRQAAPPASCLLAGRPPVGLTAIDTDRAHGARPLIDVLRL